MNDLIDHSTFEERDRAASKLEGHRRPRHRVKLSRDEFEKVRRIHIAAFRKALAGLDLPRVK